MCEFTARAQTALPGGVHAPAQARRFLAAQVCRAHGADVLDEALLLVSEVVTNAVRHGLPPVTVAVDCADSHHLQVRVSDADPDRPTMRSPDLFDEHGRGLELVDLLSTRWGVDADHDGKTVWFLLASSPGLSPA